MNTYSPVRRPVLLGELALAFDVPLGRLEQLADRHQILPAFWAGGMRFYGPEQARALYAAIHAGDCSAAITG